MHITTSVSSHIEKNFHSLLCLFTRPPPVEKSASKLLFRDFFTSVCDWAVRWRCKALEFSFSQSSNGFKSPIFELNTTTLTRPSLVKLVEAVLVFVGLVVELVALGWPALTPPGRLELASASRVALVDSMAFVFLVERQVKVWEVGRGGPGSRNASAIETQFPRRKSTLKSLSPACSIIWPIRACFLEEASASE